MSDAIRSWLNSSPRNYAAGLSLLPPGELTRRLAQGETERRRKELFAAVKALLNAPAPPVEVPQNCGEKPAPDQPLTDVAIAARRDADKLYKEMQNTRAALFATCTVEEKSWENEPDQVRVRGELAKRVIALQYQVDAAYEVAKYAAIHGQLPPVAEEKAQVVDAVQLHQAISNLRKYISKLRKQEQTAKVLQKIQEKESLLKQYLNDYEQAKAG